MWNVTAHSDWHSRSRAIVWQIIWKSMTGYFEVPLGRLEDFIESFEHISYPLQKNDNIVFSILCHGYTVKTETFL